MPSRPRIAIAAEPADVIDIASDPVQCYLVLRNPMLRSKVTAGTITAHAADRSAYRVSWWWDDPRDGGERQDWIPAMYVYLDRHPTQAELDAIDSVPPGLATLLTTSTGAPHPPIKGRPGGG